MDEDIVENNNNMKFGSLNKYSPLMGSVKPMHGHQHMSMTSLSPSPFQSQNTTEQVLPTPPNMHTGWLHPSVNNLSFSHSQRYTTVNLTLSLTMSY